MDKTVKQILEEAFKRILEEHRFRIEGLNVQWIERINGDDYPVSFKIDGQVL